MDIKRRIKSIGMACFIEFFYDWRGTEIMNLLTEKGYKETASKTRINNSRKIFEESKEKDILKIIMESQKIKNNDLVTYSKVVEILNKIENDK